VASGGLLAGANVQQWPSNGAAAQRWSIEGVGGGYFRIVNKNSLKVLDVAGCSLSNGANVQQWDWTGGDCQLWQLNVVP
jgi:Ricin-type beta-trefoil lectin domain-like